MAGAGSALKERHAVQQAPGDRNRRRLQRNRHRFQKEGRHAQNGRSQPRLRALRARLAGLLARKNTTYASGGVFEFHDFLYIIKLMKSSKHSAEPVGAAKDVKPANSGSETAPEMSADKLPVDAQNPQ